MCFGGKTASSIGAFREQFVDNTGLTIVRMLVFLVLGLVVIRIVQFIARAVSLKSKPREPPPFLFCPARRHTQKNEQAHRVACAGNQPTLLKGSPRLSFGGNASHEPPPFLFCPARPLHTKK